MNRTEIEALLIEKAQSEPAFRQQLIANPRATIESVTGLALPSHMTISVFEETPASLALVLPAVPATELSDADLADISGGVDDGKPPKGKNETQMKARAWERVNGHR